IVWEEDYPAADAQPTAVKLIADGVEVATGEVQMNDVAWEELEIFKTYVAQVGEDKFESLQEAFEAAVDGDVIVLIDNTSVDAQINNSKKVTLDLNGFEITGTDTTAKNFGLINNTGVLVIEDSVGTGKITVTATVESNTSRYSAVISNNPGGVLTVNGGTIEHLGGTYMAYGIDSLTNSNIAPVSVTVNGGVIKSTYRGIRQFLNSTETMNSLVINGGTVEGANKSIFFHDPSTKANVGSLEIGENAVINGDVYLFVTANSTEYPVDVQIAAAALQGESTVLTANFPEGYTLELNNGVYGVAEFIAAAHFETAPYAQYSATKPRESFNINVYDINVRESLVVKIYSGETLVAETSLREADKDDATNVYIPGEFTKLSMNTVISGKEAGSWVTDWKVEPSVANVPDKLEVYADGTLTDTWTADRNEGMFFASEAELNEYLGYEGVYKAATVTSGDVDTHFMSVVEAFFGSAAGDTITVYEATVVEEDVTLDFEGKTIVGDVYPVIRVQNGATVTIENGNITNGDYVFVLGAADGSSEGNLVINSGTYVGETTVASVTKGTLTINGGEFSVVDDTYNYAYTLNCIDANYRNGEANIVVNGGTFHNFNPADNAAEGNGTSFVAEGYEAVDNGDGTFTVQEGAPELPEATVTDAENDELTFAKKFTVVEPTEKQLAYYGDWYADFELTVNKDVTFNANGGADGYLSGQYDAYSENWVNVPFKDVTLKAGESLKIMEYAAELMGKPGLKYTYAEVYEEVKDFNCGVFFEDIYLIENPDLVVTLELRIYNNENEEENYVIGETFTFEAPEVAIPTRPTATVTEIENEDLTFAMNFKADDVTKTQLAYYGDWYADYVLTVSKDVTFNANGGADGYLSGQYDEWSANWVSVPFKDVELKANESLKIMEYAAEMLGKPGLKYTYKDVYESVKDFDCGVFFEPAFLAANTDLVVTLELRIYNNENKEENYVIGETYTFKAEDVIPALPTATVTEIENEDLTFAMNFKADEATNAQLKYYGKWYADYELTVSNDVTFNANGGADGYLSGQYDEWSANWVSVPFKDVELKAGETLKIMEYASEMLGKPGLKVTCNDIYKSVKDFDCGVFFEPEFLKANPGLVVTLALKMYNPADEEESYVIGETYTFTVPAYVAEGEGELYETLQAAIDEAVEGLQVTLLADVAEDVTVGACDKAIEIITGDHSYTGAVTLAEYGAWVIADEEVEVISADEETPIVKGEGNGKYGYVAMELGVNMVQGAQVRFGSGVDENGKVARTEDKEEGSGLRFITEVNRNETLAGTDSTELGVLVTAEGSTAITEIPAVKWQDEDKTVFTSAITNLNETNYVRQFTAVGYADVDGIRYVGNDGVTRSIYKVAAGLLKTNNAETNVEGETYDPTDAKLVKVLNAYVNQTGIRLVLVDNELVAHTGETSTKGGAYKSEAFFEAGETTVNGNIYTVTLTPVGDNTEFKAYWTEYIRINNNHNKVVNGVTNSTLNEDGTLTLVFDLSAVK
ncbi:MAG: hypothetical protein IKU60_05095, partial [Clostridia bacterium]|nr:hypothetical protein [Clostridia bacterium]